MTIIENTVQISRPVEEVFNFLADMNNHQQLMPENIYNWSSTRDEARFTIQNMAKLAIHISERKEFSEIVAVPSEKAPFEVELKWVLEDGGNGSTTAKHIISADLNMMMKMLASGPLQKLVNHETEKLKEILG
ncbi:SRPBCC family protein [Pedobacter sp. SYP-B3415]|uniref:SRPBCC family protein n=1 Tax=Pedobacter sp. SYP-B3415 TaxID=2496641 RepID=UPI00101C0729|nr:SRPBCC family protein [Pedobacter sp. SYP-B3415]